MAAGLKNEIFKERYLHGRIRGRRGLSQPASHETDEKYCEPYLEIAVTHLRSISEDLNLYFFPAYANFQLYTYNRWIPQIERLLFLLLMPLC